MAEMVQHLFQEIPSVKENLQRFSLQRIQLEKSDIVPMISAGDVLKSLGLCSHLQSLEIKQVADVRSDLISRYCPSLKTLPLDNNRYICRFEDHSNIEHLSICEDEIAGEFSENNPACFDFPAESLKSLEICYRVKKSQTEYPHIGWPVLQKCYSNFMTWLAISPFTVSVSFILTKSDLPNLRAFFTTLHDGSNISIHDASRIFCSSSSVRRLRILSKFPRFAIWQAGQVRRMLPPHHNNHIKTPIDT